MDDFALRWRFAEDATKWTVLPEADLKRLRPLTEGCARELWAQLVSPHGAHLMALQIAGTSTSIGACIASHRTQADWSSSEERVRVTEFLTKHMQPELMSPVLFFWSARCAVRTDWDILLRYWSDFCYPSDDSNIALVDQVDITIIYADERVWLQRWVPPA